jgi:hypothetical protein
MRVAGVASYFVESGEGILTRQVLGVLGRETFKTASARSGHLVILCIGNIKNEYRVKD